MSSHGGDTGSSCAEVRALANYAHPIGFPGGSVVKNPPANTGDSRDTRLIPGSEQSPGEGNGDPLQYSCLGNPMERGAKDMNEPATET